LPAKAKKNEWNNFFCETVVETGIHQHSFSCAKPPAGKDGCRGARPCDCVLSTEPVELIAPPKEKQEKPERNAKGR